MLEGLQIRELLKTVPVLVSGPWVTLHLPSCSLGMGNRVHSSAWHMSQEVAPSRCRLRMFREEDIFEELVKNLGSGSRQIDRQSCLKCSLRLRFACTRVHVCVCVFTWEVPNPVCFGVDVRAVRTSGRGGVSITETQTTTIPVQSSNGLMVDW